MHAKATGSRHIPALDGLRGLAIAFVLLFHFTGPLVGRNLADRLALNCILAGWTGVDLFFVLSGFLITGILYDSKSSQHCFRNFYVRRFLRIFPLYYGFLFGLFVVLPMLRPFRSPEMIQNAKDQLWFWTYTANIGLAFKGPWAFGMLGHFWSLAIEEQFYLFWPMLILFCERSTAIRVCAALIGLAFALRLGLVAFGYSFMLAFTLTPCRIDALACGALVALVARGPTGLCSFVPVARRIALGAFAVVLAISWYYGAFQLKLPLVQIFGYSAVSALYASVLVLVICTRTKVGDALATNRILRTLGKYSYSLYLIHVPAEPTLYRLFSFPGAKLAERLHSEFLGALPLVILGTAALLGISRVLWLLWEKPFLDLKRHFPEGTARGGMGL